MSAMSAWSFGHVSLVGGLILLLFYLVECCLDEVVDLTIIRWRSSHVDDVLKRSDSRIRNFQDLMIHSTWKRIDLHAHIKDATTMPRRWNA